MDPKCLVISYGNWIYNNMPIKLTELLHSIAEDKNQELVNLDDWKYPDVDHLVTMGFDFNDDHHLTTNKEPHISVYKKKEKDKENNPCEIFYVEEERRGKKRFQNFNDVIEYFDTYSQPELDKNT